MTSRLSLAIMTSLSVLAVSAAHADTIALNSTGGGAATSASDQIYGWQFTVNGDINVTSLGVFDEGDDGLSVAHDVGIFRVSDQSLVGSITVPSGTGGALVDGFRFFALGSSLALTAGQDYVIAMTMPALNDDRQNIQTDLPTTASEITYVNSRFDTGSTLAFPGGLGDFAPGMFGPNFLFNDGTTVPEPSTLVMGLVPALLSLIAARRRSLSRNAA